MKLRIFRRIDYRSRTPVPDTMAPSPAFVARSKVVVNFLVKKEASHSQWYAAFASPCGAVILSDMQRMQLNLIFCTVFTFQADRVFRSQKPAGSRSRIIPAVCCLFLKNGRLTPTSTQSAPS